jgi:diacylglycerol kinase (ATP)
MRISLLYNGAAGDDVSLERIRSTVESQGHELARVVETAADAQALVEERPDLIVAAGGDGTVSVAAQVLRGLGIPLAILPIGTANNVAKGLGIQGPIEKLIERWTGSDRRPFDLGVAHGEWGRRWFLESVGCGLISTVIAESDTRPVGSNAPVGWKLAHAVDWHRDALARLRPREYTISTDGTRVTGEFIMVEVLNVPSVGPNLELSADADPSDGLFCIVTAGEDDFEELFLYFQHRLEDRDHRLSLTTRRARQVEIVGCQDMHVDDEVVSWTSCGPVYIDITPAAIQILV